MSTGRVDYLRFILADRISGRASERLRFVRDYIKEECGFGKPEWDGCWNKRSWWNGKEGQEYHEIVIWGELSDRIAQRIEMTSWQFVTRVDWRVEIPEPQFSYNEMYTAMKSRSNQKVRFMELTSAEKEKATGRNYGGKSLYSGSPASDRRMAYYQRGSEPFALECRFQGVIAHRVYKTAVSRYESAHQLNAYDCVTEALATYSSELVAERTGLSPEEVYCAVPRARTNEPLTTQLEMITLMERMWDKLSDKARDAFVAANVKKP